jgi:thioredoxin 1
MKDAVICFVLALVLGSIWNGMQSGSPGGEGSDSQNMGAPLNPVTDANFQNEVLDQTQPVLVDFYTQSCPHCKTMAPILVQIAQEYSSNLKVVKVDIMDNPQIAHKYEINGVPAFMLFENGKAVESFVGAMPKARFLSIIKPHLHAGTSDSASPGGAT